MRRLLLLSILCIGYSCVADAQSTFTQRLQKSSSGEGTVILQQDKAIDDLVNGPKQNKTTTQGTPKSKTEDRQPNSKTEHHAQVSERNESSDSINVPIEDNRKKILKGGLKINGYRVQVYAGGNSREARVKAEKTGKEINSLFPGEPVYVHFYSPRWICRMGNYRTYEEAHQVLNAIKKLGYQSAIIVKGKITVPY